MVAKANSQDFAQYCRFCRSTLLWVQKTNEKVIADTPLLDQDGRGGHSEQPIVDIPEAKKDM